MYRGQDIGDFQQLEAKCLSILQEGNLEALYDILPHLSILRSSSFRRPIEKLLESSDRDKKQFAVIALGVLGAETCLGPLTRLASKIRGWHGPGVRSLERTLIAALGETGSAESLPPLLELFRFKRPRDKFAGERRRAVVTALATLVQHGVNEALGHLLELLDHPLADIRAQAASEIGFAFWSGARQVPQSVLERLSRALDDPDPNVAEATRLSLEELITLGNREARGILDAP